MSKDLDQQLQLVNQVLEKAFFAPLSINDWLGFCFNQPFLLGLAQEECKDLFARCALADQRLNPKVALSPVARLLRHKKPAEVLAHALASLRDDRPFLFHRTLSSLIHDEQVSPEDFTSLEEMLDQSLRGEMDLQQSAAREIASLRAQALDMLPKGDTAQIKKQVKRLLASEQLADIQSEAQLRLWLGLGSGGQKVPPAILPQVLVEVWAAWCGAVTGSAPNPELLMQCQPHLQISARQLADYLPPQAEENPALSANCPYCQESNVIVVGQDKIEATHRCPHLVFIGTDDAMHLLRALLIAQASVGDDTLDLLDSYYQSPSHWGLFTSVVHGLYQLLNERERLKAVAVSGTPRRQAFSHLRAYFSQPLPAKADA